MVPNKISIPGSDAAAKKGKFELKLNEKEVIVIPMHPGLILTYSGYLLTHRQQITSGDDLSSSLVNLVTYNSEQLFSNLMESFRRDINMDKKPCLVKNNLDKINCNI